MKAITVELYDNCDGDPCEDNECPHNLVVVVLCSEGKELYSEIVIDTQENIMQAVADLARELF